LEAEVIKEPLHDDWFNRAPESAPSVEWNRASLPGQPAGDPLWSSVTGSIAGVLGAMVVLLFAIRFDVRARPELGAEAALAGAVLGGLFGRVTRRLLPLFPRVALGTILAGATWLVLYALVLLRFAPQWAHATPFSSSMVNALIFGAVIGILPPVRVRYERGRKL
jgi:hypothetical protein